MPTATETLIPDRHDVELAAQARAALETLARSEGDLTVTVTGENGVAEQLRMPASAVRLLSAAMAEVANGHAVSVLPVNTDLTTQEAADILNVSRPFVVGLLERGEMAYRKVGSQRRVSLREVLDYKARTDIGRRAALDALARQAQELGLGYEA